MFVNHKHHRQENFVKSFTLMGSISFVFGIKFFLMLPDWIIWGIMVLSQSVCLSLNVYFACNFRPIPGTEFIFYMHIPWVKDFQTTSLLSALWPWTWPRWLVSKGRMFHKHTIIFVLFCVCFNEIYTMATVLRFFCQIAGIKCLEYLDRDLQCRNIVCI